MNTDMVREKSLNQIIGHSKFLLSLMNADADIYVSGEFREQIFNYFVIPDWMHSVESVRQCTQAEEDAIVYDFAVGQKFIDYVSGQEALAVAWISDFVIPLVSKNLTFASQALLLSFGIELRKLPAIVAGTCTVRVAYFNGHLHVCTVAVEETQKEAGGVMREDLCNFMQSTPQKPEHEFDLSKWFPDIHSVTAH
jgi:hypothetical protein